MFFTLNTVASEACSSVVSEACSIRTVFILWFFEHFLCTKSTTVVVLCVGGTITSINWLRYPYCWRMGQHCCDQESSFSIQVDFAIKGLKWTGQTWNLAMFWVYFVYLQISFQGDRLLSRRNLFPFSELFCWCCCKAFSVYFCLFFFASSLCFLHLGTKLFKSRKAFPLSSLCK